MRRRLASFLVLVLLAAPAWPAGKSARPRVYDLVAGGEQDYTVAPGDNLWAITGRFTMNRSLLQSWNDLPDPHALRPGPPSIEAEMRAQGEKVVGSVLPGPDTPLGKYWIQLSAPGYGLHGTNAPASIGKYVSHGCMRLLPEHVELLYREARDGTPVDIIYEPVKLARSAGGGVFLEVHRDVLGARQSELPAVFDFIQAAGLSEAVDATRVVDAVARAWGTPEDVSLQPPPEPAAGRPAAAVVPAGDANPSGAAP